MRDLIGIYDVPQGHRHTAPQGEAQHIIYTLCDACSQLPNLAAQVEQTFTAPWN